MQPEQQTRSLEVLLADDDIDDCIFFKGALDKSAILTRLTTVHDGMQLMQLLIKPSCELPDVIFLDLNMPRKNGFECLFELKLSAKLRHLPVIMYSTSNDQDVVSRLYENGAHYFIRKPSMIAQFEKIIHRTLCLMSLPHLLQPERAHFVVELLPLN